MATLISAATGNFTTSSTWALCDSTSELDSEAGSTTSTTSFVYTATFTPGAITVDGVAVKLSVVTSTTGTTTIELFNNTDTASVASTTINNTDYATGTTLGWYFFKFSGSQTLIAGKAYKVGFKTSTAGTVTLLRNATAANWSRQLRTTTTQAPAASDKLLVMGEHTGAGTGNDITVTMNNTATTAFGSVWVGKRGTLTWGTSASTDYYLKLSGNAIDAVARAFEIMSAGTVNIGTSGTAIPSTSTAVVEFNCASNVESGWEIRAGSTLNIYGNALSNFRTLLTADKAIAATTLAVSSTTGWAASDVLIVASTTRTASESEAKSILTVDNGTQVTLTAGLTNAHSGTSPTQAEVINITRNVRIRGINSTNNSYININATASVTWRYAEISNMGSVTALKRGIDVATTTGAFDISGCSIHDFTNTGPAVGLNVTSASGNNISVVNTAFYNMYRSAVAISSTTGTQTYNGIIAILSIDSGTGTSYSLFSAQDVGSTYNDITVISNVSTAASSAGINFTESNALINCTNLVVHSNTTNGIALTSTGGTCDTVSCWRNATGSTNYSGFFISAINTTINNVTAFGNANSNMVFADHCCFNLFYNLIVNGDTTFSSPYGIRFTTASVGTANSFTGMNVIESSSFGASSGIKTTHTSADIGTTNLSLSSLNFFRSCLFNSSTPVATNTSNGSQYYWVFSQKHNQTGGSHKTYCNEGTISTDTTFFNTASPSMRMTPSNATNKLVNGPNGYGFTKKVDSGNTVTASVYIRKSAIGDGAAYNGNQPRLSVRRNLAAGITADTVLATYSGSTGSWAQISGTTASVTDDSVLEFIVDCDGTAGWINVDDFA